MILVAYKTDSSALLAVLTGARLFSKCTWFSEFFACMIKYKNYVVNLNTNVRGTGQGEAVHRKHKGV
jgi:hypothetical protein